MIDGSGFLPLSPTEANLYLGSFSPPGRQRKYRDEHALMVSSHCEFFGYIAAVFSGRPFVEFAERTGSGSHLGIR